MRRKSSKVEKDLLGHQRKSRFDYEGFAFQLLKKT